MKDAKIIFSSLLTLIVFMMIQASIQASSPIIRVGKLERNADCNATQEKADLVITKVTAVDIDTFVRDSLPHELTPRDPIEALKAQAVLIRSVANYFHQNPQSDWGSFCNNTGQTFHLNTDTIRGWKNRQGSWLGNSDNMTNDRVTDTMSQVLRDDGQDFETQFNSCIQGVLVDLANQGLTHYQILTDLNQGIYSGQYTSCNYPRNGTSFNRRTGLSVNDAYHFIRSLTNGTSPYPISGASHTSAVTFEEHARQAESYWGHSGMNIGVLHRPWNQSGTYMTSSYQGGKVEYLMKFGLQFDLAIWRWRNFENLHLIGISDIPQDVLLNIYLDGYYQGTMKWTEGDNRRHLRVDKISNISNSNSTISYNTHAIAIEFANDYCVCNPWHPDTDRNFYIDVLGVNDGPIHERGMEAISPFFAVYELYLPLLLK